MNPEFVKNCWLQLTVHRLVATPAILALLVLLAGTLVDERRVLAELLGSWLLAGTFAFACLGGSYATAASMIEEFAGNTWDQQRLSPLSPWSLTWGKVLGGAVFMWYATALQLVLLLGVPLLLGSAHGWAWHARLAAGLVGFALACQAFGLLTVLSVANAPDRLLRYRRNYGVALVILVAFIGLWVWRLVDQPSAASATLAWWGTRLDAGNFWLASIWSFAGWALLGAYRLMREQMQFRNGPWAWVAFNLYLMGYCAGFVAGIEHDAWRLRSMAWMAFGVGLTLCYASVLLQPTGPLALRHLHRVLARRQWSALPASLPSWTLSYLLAALVALAGVQLPDDPLLRLPEASLLAALLLFAARDLGLFVGFTLGRRPQRAVVTTALYLLLLYLPIPALCKALGFSAVLGFFWPIHAQEVQLWPVAVELALVAVWLRGRFAAAARVTPGPRPAPDPAP